jgi:phosphonate transport system permease protein
MQNNLKENRLNKRFFLAFQGTAPDLLVGMLGVVLFLTGFFLPWLQKADATITGLRMGMEGFPFIFLLPVIGLYTGWRLVFKKRARPLVSLTFVTVSVFIVVLFLSLILNSDEAYATFRHNSKMGVHLQYGRGESALIFTHLSQVAIGWYLLVSGMICLFTAPLFHPADSLPAARVVKPQPCRSQSQYQSLEQIKATWTLSGEYKTALFWGLSGVILIFAYTWCDISPATLWENRGNAREYLFGREMNAQDKAYIEDQRRRAPEIEAQGRARAYQDNKYHRIPIKDQPGLEEKFKENEKLVARFLSEMSDEEKAELRQKAYAAARDEKRGGYFPPDTGWAKVRGYLVALLETVAIAIWGTLLAVICSVPVSLLAARNTLELIIGGDGAGARALRRFCIFGVRRFLDACRGFNEFVMALIFVAVIGLGPYAGILALWIHTFGILGKVFSEQIEAVEGGQIEALASTGAGVDQTIAFSVLPQVMPGFVSYSLLRFESNVRSAAILGFVGAGGIGFLIFDKLNGYLFREVCSMMIIIIVAVGIIDYLCGNLRRRFI